MSDVQVVDVGNPTTAMEGPTQEGSALAAVRRAITIDAIAAYRQASGDNNRIHYDDDFAAGTRFGGVIAHGMLTLTLVSEMLTKSYGVDWLTSGSLRTRFRGAAYPCDTLEATGTVIKSEPADHGTRVTCSVEIHNSKNDDRIITGTASLLVGTTK